MADISKIILPSGDEYNLKDSVFAASAAAGITSTDISNWNAKVSDDKTWNGVSLDKTSQVTNGADFYVPYIATTTSTQAKLMPAGDGAVKYRLVSRDGSGYIKSTTPAATENSTKVATTAYVTRAISNIDIPALEPVANVEAMLTSLGLAINLNLTAAAAGTAETGHAVVQEG